LATFARKNRDLPLPNTLEGVILVAQSPWNGWNVGSEEWGSQDHTIEIAIVAECEL
jgi:hypothetical protein